MEFARGGDLLRYTLRHYPVPQQEDQARWIFQQLVIGLDYCHKMVSHLSGSYTGADADAPAKTISDISTAQSVGALRTSFSFF